MTTAEDSTKHPPLTAGSSAPEFTLPTESGAMSLQDHRGTWVVLYFYPADFTSGCTQEACDFRDAMAEGALDATVLGVSPDDVASHARFRAEHGLEFPLLADTDHAVAKAYGAWGNKGVFGWGVKRTTFVIDPVGKIAQTFYDVNTQGHVAEVAETLKRLRG